MLHRNIYTEIESLMKVFPSVAIVGPRQCGKTTLAMEFLKDAIKDALYLDLEAPSDMIKLSEPELFFKDNNDKLIILDEIQRMPELFPVLRSVIDQKRVAGRFLILGSANPSIMRDSSESLAGRIAYKELSGFNLTEINPKEMELLWLRGGFPNSFLSPDNALARIWVQNFIITYAERDLPLLGLNVAPRIILNLLKIIASAQGSLLNVNEVSRSIGLTAPTVNKYIDFMEKAFLLFRLNPFYVNIQKRLVKSPKLYIRDSGILHYLINTFDHATYKTNYLTGGSWEGFVIEQIRQALPDPLNMYFYRTQSGTECDLVIANGNKPVSAIEIKYSLSPSTTKSFTMAINDLKTTNNFIITPGIDSFQLKEQVRVTGLHDFLTKYINVIL